MIMSDFWYPFYPSRFKANTRHLTAEQDGIYRRLIDEYMETREPLPDNDIALARIAGVNENSWLDAKRIVIAYFTHNNGMLYHDFCDQMLDVQDKKAKRRSQSAEKAAKKRWEKHKQKQVDTCGTHAQRNANAMRGDATDTDTDTDTKKEREEGGDLKDLDLAVELYNFTAREIGISVVQKLSATRKKHLRARLKDCDGLEGWKAALEILSNSNFCKGENERGWKADFDFLVKESSFIKLMEGKYNGNNKQHKVGTAGYNKQQLQSWLDS